jgi:transcriptional regulator with XRE-family HTH domain
MKKQGLTEILRDAVRRYDNHLDLSKQTGVVRASIGRFARGERSLRLDKAALLADFLGLELARKTKRGRGRG